MMRYLMSVILSILSAVLTVYTILCFLNIIMSWLPGIKFTAFGKFISSITDPYLNFFSKWRFLTIGHIDFSPIISIGLLSLASSILSGIQSTGRIYFGGILATVIYMLWNIISSILSIFLLFVIIRWIMLLVSKGSSSYNSTWNQIDAFLQKVSYKVAGTFSKNTFSMTYKKSLLITWITFLVILLFGNVLTRILVGLCYQLPF